MSNFLASLTPEDVLAFIVVVGCMILKFKGMDGSTDNIITAVISYRLGQHSKKTPAARGKAKAKAAVRRPQ